MALPLVVVPAAGYVALSNGTGGSRLVVAQGKAGSVLHPIADGFVADDTKLAECDGEVACLEQAFGNIAFRDGPRAALAVFERGLTEDPTVRKGCHRIAHVIGAGALERFDGDVSRAFSRGSPACVSGYYHGILERAFLGVSSKRELAGVARAICAEARFRRMGFLDYQCRHGLGHGLMIQTGYDLPLTLSICARLGTGWDRKACASGAFMENVNTRFGYRSPWLDDSDPLYPCTRVGELDMRSCYLRASWRIYELADRRLDKTIETCARLGRWSETCFQGLGRDTADQALHAPRVIQLRCARAGSGQGDCLFGAARTIANASGAQGVRPAVALCRVADEHVRDRCFAGLGLVLGMLQATDRARRSACMRWAGRYSGACTRAAIAEVDPSGRRSWG